MPAQLRPKASQGKNIKRCATSRSVSDLRRYGGALQLPIKPSLGNVDSYRFERCRVDLVEYTKASPQLASSLRAMSWVRMPRCGPSASKTGEFGRFPHELHAACSSNSSSRSIASVDTSGMGSNVFVGFIAREFIKRQVLHLLGLLLGLHKLFESCHVIAESKPSTPILAD